MNSKPETRTYPEPCNSRNCSHFICPTDCKHMPERQAFTEWAQVNCALILDRFTPTTYTATRSATP